MKDMIFSGFEQEHTEKLMKFSERLFKTRHWTNRKTVTKNRALLGSGRFSYAVTYGRNAVLKTNTTCDEAGCDAQGEWLKFCIENQNLSWVPTVHFAYIRDDGQYVAVMERLRDYDSVTDVSHMPKVVSYYNRQAVKAPAGEIENAIQYNGMKVNIEQILKRIADSKKQARCETLAIRAAEEFVKHGLKDAVVAIADIKRNYGGWLDLHNGNFMFRDTGNGYQFVITDPLVRD